MSPKLQACVADSPTRPFACVGAKSFRRSQSLSRCARLLQPAEAIHRSHRSSHDEARTRSEVPLRGQLRTALAPLHYDNERSPISWIRSFLCVVCGWFLGVRPSTDSTERPMMSPGCPAARASTHEQRGNRASTLGKRKILVVTPAGKSRGSGS